tara:strand:- start:93 stop:497 length:405 start_codon:yes stop_codon:yes gene_type:complete
MRKNIRFYFNLALLSFLPILMGNSACNSFATGYMEASMERDNISSGKSYIPKNGGVIMIDDCDNGRIIIETHRGYTVAEPMYQSYNFMSGRDVFGRLHSFGYQTLYKDGGGEAGRVFITDYAVSQKKSIDLCIE